MVTEFLESANPSAWQRAPKSITASNMARQPSPTNTILLLLLLKSMIAMFHLLRLKNRKSNPTLTCVQHGEAAAADGRHAAAAVQLHDGGTLSAPFEQSVYH